MPDFKPIARAPGAPGQGTPGQVPDIQGDVEQAIAALQLRGEHRFSIEGKSYVVYVSDHRDVPMVKAALAPVEQSDGIKVSVKVGQ